jgi:hypothetical protein
MPLRRRTTSIKASNAPEIFQHNSFSTRFSRVSTGAELEWPHNKPPTRDVVPKTSPIIVLIEKPSRDFTRKLPSHHETYTPYHAICHPCHNVLIITK